MGIVELIVITLIAGVIVWALGQFPAIDATFKRVITIAIYVVVVILWILYVASYFGYHSSVRLH